MPRPDRIDEVLVLHAFTLKHQRASDAIPLVHPLLSERGTVELQPGDNTLVIRDSPGALARILPPGHRVILPATVIHNALPPGRMPRLYGRQGRLPLLSSPP